MRVFPGISTIILAACSSPPPPALVPAGGLAASALSSPAYRWDSVASKGVLAYFNRGSWADSNRTALMTRLDASLQHVTRMIDVPSDTVIRVFFVASRDQLQELVGMPSNGTADAIHRTVVLVANDAWSPFDRHELMHVVSLQTWGDPGGASPRSGEWARHGWLREGIAAAAEDRCGVYPGIDVAAAMHAGGRRITVEDLTSRFYELDDLDAYLQAGTLVQFLLEQHGREKFRELWNAGGDRLAATYGIAVPQIDAAWQAWVAKSPVDRQPDIGALRVRGCG